MSYMQDLVSQTFRLTVVQVEALETKAAELRINKSELLRRILDERRFEKAERSFMSNMTEAEKTQIIADAVMKAVKEIGAHGWPETPIPSPTMQDIRDNWQEDALMKIDRCIKGDLTGWAYQTADKSVSVAIGRDAMKADALQAFLKHKPDQWEIETAENRTLGETRFFRVRLVEIENEENENAA